MSFAVFDQDSIVEALKRVWDDIAPAAMFTATGNITLANTENFLNALDMLKWNVTTQEGILGAANTPGGTTGYVPDGHPGGSGSNSQGSHPGGYGFSGTSSIDPSTTHGSNGKPVLGTDDFNRYNVVGWEDSTDKIRVPAGFTPLRGQNIIYADTLPPLLLDFIMSS